MQIYHHRSTKNLSLSLLPLSPCSFTRPITRSGILSERKRERSGEEMERKFQIFVLPPPWFSILIVSDSTAAESTLYVLLSSWLPPLVIWCVYFSRYRYEKKLKIRFASAFARRDSLLPGENVFFKLDLTSFSSTLMLIFMWIVEHFSHRAPRIQKYLISRLRTQSFFRWDIHKNEIFGWTRSLLRHESVQWDLWSFSGAAFENHFSVDFPLYLVCRIFLQSCLHSLSIYSGEKERKKWLNRTKISEPFTHDENEQATTAFEDNFTARIPKCTKIFLTSLSLSASQLHRRRRSSVQLSDVSKKYKTNPTDVVGDVNNMSHMHM